MRIAGLAMTDVWAHRVLREQGVSVTQLRDAPAEISVLVDSIAMGHHGPEQNHRPYVHASGQLQAIRPVQPLPEGITEVLLEPEEAGTVDLFYEFTDEQLAVLVAKGYFTPGFRAPQGVTGYTWELPAQVDALVLSGEDEEPPIVFTGVRDAGHLVITAENSGYELTEYFADFSREEVVLPVLDADEKVPYQLEDFTSLFSREEIEASTASQRRSGSLDLHSDEGELAEQEQRSEGSAGFQEAFVLLEQEVEAEEDQLRREREDTEGTLEHLYRERIANGLEDPEDHEEHEHRGRHRDTAQVRTELLRRTAGLDHGEDESQLTY